MNRDRRWIFSSKSVARQIFLIAMAFWLAPSGIAGSTDDSQEQESQSIDFVQSHHPELVVLLQRLKEMDRDEYDSAIRDIIKVRKRLDSLEKRDSELHAVELEGWKVQSQIDLMLAKAVARDKDFDPRALKELVKRRVSYQKKRLNAERAGLTARQKQIDESLDRLVGHEEERVSQQLALLMKKVDSNKSRQTKSTKQDKALPKRVAP